MKQLFRAIKSLQMSVNKISPISIKKIITYLIIICALLPGTRLIYIEPESPTFYFIKYFVIGGVVISGVLFYIKSKRNENSLLYFLQLTLSTAFIPDYQLHYIFLLLTIVLFNKKLILPFNSIFKVIYILIAWAIFSYLINQFIEFNPLSFPIYFLTFFLPFIYLGLFYLNSKVYYHELVKFFLDLNLIVVGIIILQSLFLTQLHPDYWNGGTPNAHIAAAYLSIAFVLSITSFKSIKDLSFTKNFRRTTIAVITFPILFLVDAKYFFVLNLLITAFYFLAISDLSRKIKAAIVGIFAIITVIFFSTPSNPIPISILTLKSQEYNLNVVNLKFINSPKDQLLKAVFKLPLEYPLTFILGSGPGTFLSRADYTQYSIANKNKTVKFNEGREKINFKSEIAVKDTWIRKKYANGFFESTYDPGSFYNRKSGLISMYFELGIIGLVLFIFFYLQIAKKAITNPRFENDKDYRAIAILCFLFVIMNYFTHWFEYQNYSIIQYGIMGILLARISTNQTKESSNIEINI